MSDIFEDKTWKDTVFDSNARQKYFYNAFEKHDRTRVFYYIISIILYIISFKFLLDHRNATYISYIFTFIINVLSPFLWIEDYLKIRSIASESALLLYKTIGIAFGCILTFVGLFLVLITNDLVRKIKLGDFRKKRANEEETRDPINNIYLKDDHKKKQNDKVILTTYISIVVFIWSMLGETFSNSTSFASYDKTNIEVSGFSKIIGWLLDQPYYFAKIADDFIHSWSDMIEIPKLVKGLLVYSIAFIILIFSAFLRITPRPRNKDGTLGFYPRVMDRFSVVGIGNVFTEIYDRNHKQYRSFVLAVWSLICTILLSICINLKVSDLLLKGILILISFVGSLGLFFGIGSKADAYETKRWVLSLLCFLLAALGTPVAYGIFQLLNKVEIVSTLLTVFFTPIIIGALFVGCIGAGIAAAVNSRKDAHAPVGIISGACAVFGAVLGAIWSAILNGKLPFLNVYSSDLQNYFSTQLMSTDNRGLYIMPVIFVAIFVTMTLFINFNMETFMKKKSIKMFIATLITMAVSLFVAYCSLYNGFSHLYTFIKSILEFTIVVPMPLVTIIVSLVHVAYSMTNYRKFKRRYNTDK